MRAFTTYPGFFSYTFVENNGRKIFANADLRALFICRFASSFVMGYWMPILYIQFVFIHYFQNTILNRTITDTILRVNFI